MSDKTTKCDSTLNNRLLLLARVITNMYTLNRPINTETRVASAAAENPALYFTVKDQ